MIASPVVERKGDREQEASGQEDEQQTQDVDYEMQSHTVI
jgi:hypothetical protein